MPATPRRRGHEPRPGSRFLADVLSDNLRAARSRERLTQEDVADRMRCLGHATWSRSTVSQIEGGGRSVTVDELVSLGIALSATLRELTSPAGRQITMLTIDGFLQGAAGEWLNGRRVHMREMEDGTIGGRYALEVPQPWTTADDRDTRRLTDWEQEPDE